MRRFTREQRRAVAKLQGGFFCYYCQSETASLAVEHILPRAKSGTDDLRNLVLACNACNTYKGQHDTSTLKALGHDTIAKRMTAVLAERANWTFEDMRNRIANALPQKDPGYDVMRRLPRPNNPIATVINVAMHFAKLSKYQLQKRAGLGSMTLDFIMSGRRNVSVHMLHRISTATGYPIEKFLKVWTGWSSPPRQPQTGFRSCRRETGIIGAGTEPGVWC